MPTKYKAHLFICTNKKEGKPCCSERGATELHAQVKDVARQRWGAEVRINKSGCLDRCTEGIAAVLYPQAEWFTGLTHSTADAEVLIEAIEGVLDPES